MVTCNMSSGPRDRKPSEAVRENTEEVRTGNFNYNNHNHEPPAAVTFREHDNRPYIFNSNSNANLDEEIPMEVSPTVRPALNFKLDHHDHMEAVSVTLYIREIIMESLRIEYEERSVQVTFRTKDEGFLKNYVSVDEDDFFQWQMEPSGPIVPEKCTHRLKLMNLEIKLVKAIIGKWDALEASAGSGLTNRASFHGDQWISLAPPKTPPRPPVIADGNANAKEDDEPRSPAAAPASPAVPIKIGYTGLGNLGNTCYMNAVLQCLANTAPLRDYFLCKSLQSELNRENPLGFGGSLAIAFAVILRQLWSGQRDSIDPAHLKALLANRAPQFSGYLQHDAQEFMAFLLDGLHEDLNRVKNKPLTTAVESDGRPDSAVADEAWRVYKMRNDSVIVDLFQGQYKSTLVCPSCDKVSVTFDPFLYLALPLPPSKSCFNVTLFLSYDASTDSDDDVPSPGAVRTSLWLDPNERVEHLKREIKRRFANRLRHHDSEIEVVQVHDGRIRRWLVDQAPLSSLSNNSIDTSLFAFETAPCTEDSPQIQISIIQSCQKSHWSSVHRNVCRFKPFIIGEPFVISLPTASLTFERLYKTMLHYARFSVDVTRGAASPSASRLNDSSPNHDMDSSGSSLSSLSSLSSTPSSPAPTHAGAEDAGAATGAVLQQKSAAFGSESQQQQQVERLFFIKPIDSQGQSKSKDRLRDRGDEVLDFEADEAPIFLALDWRNKPNQPDHCVVTPRSSMLCETLEDCDDSSEDRRSQRGVTLEHCLQQFMKPEVLSREEAWYCPKCKEHREATKQMSLWRLPEILTIQLKRFSFRNLLWRDKIDHKVDFPTRGLDLSPYLSTVVPSGPDKGAVYDLFAVVNHYGSILYGHYTAFARCPANDADNNVDNLVGWRSMDDRSVRDVIEDSVVTPAAYLLLYRRRKGGDSATREGPDGACGAGPSRSSASRLVKYSDPEEID